MGRKKQKILTRMVSSAEQPLLTPGGVERQELELTELIGMLERARSGPLLEAEVGQLTVALETLAFLTSALEQKEVSLYRLRKLLFGSGTESLRNVKAALVKAGLTEAGEGDLGTEGLALAQSDDEGAAPPGAAPPETKKRPGHGRIAATEFTGALVTEVPHHELTSGCLCPECERGRVYPLKEPSRLVRVRGMAPLEAEVLELARLRCNGCGYVFTARAPAGMGTEKYNAGATAMVGLLRYGSGVPFYRLEKLQKSLGIPLPSSIQWKLVEESAPVLESVMEALTAEAANGTVVHNDDTTMTVLETDKLKAPTGAKEGERTGIFTSGIVSVGDGHRIALYMTGRNHAGENLQEVLSRRRAGLAVPIQMCDSLSRNMKGTFKTLLAHCLAHGRRKIADVSEAFPEESLYVLEKLSEVYGHDDEAKERGLTKEERLLYHQERSGPVMEELHTYMTTQLLQRRVEPNGTLGGVFKHLLKHWKPLTLFLREAGAPLDNNLCERALKRAVMHRKNSLFYKTANGARVGDLYMTLIHTCELGEVNPFVYLVALLKNPTEVGKSPANWLPWNYQGTLASLPSPV